MSQSRNRDRRIVAMNALGNYVSLLFGSLLGFVVTPLLFRGLGQAAFGTWAIATSLATYLSLSEAGVGTATMTRTAALEGAGSDEISRVASAGQLLTLIGAGFGAIGLVVALVFLPEHLSGSGVETQSARIALAGAGAAALVGVAGNVYAGLLVGAGRMYASNVGGFLLGSTMTIAGAIAVQAGLGLPALAAAAMAAAFLQLAFRRWRLRKDLPGVSVDPRTADRPTMTLMATLAWRNSVTSIGGVLATGSDVVIVGLLLSPSKAGAYALASRTYSLVQALATRATDALTPSHASAHHHASMDDQLRYYVLSVQTSMLLATPLALTLLFLGPGLLDAWVGETPSGATVVLRILMLVLLLQLPGYSAYQVFIASERAHLLTRWILLASLTNVALSLLLVHFVGMPGPAVASLVCVLILDAWILPTRLVRLLGGRPSRALGSALRPVLFPSLALSGLLLAAHFSVSTAGQSVVAAAGALCVYAVVAGLHPANRQFLDALRLLKHGREPG